MKFFKAIGRFLLPADVRVRYRRLELMVWAFLLSLSFYPDWFGFLAWLSLVRPIIIIARLDKNEVFGAAYWFAFFFNLFTIYWVALVTPPGMLAAVLIVALYYAAMFRAFKAIYDWKPVVGLAAFPFLWTGIEYFRTLSEFAFPWSDLGYSQAYYLYILQIVSVISVHGLTLLLIAVNVLIVMALRKQLSAERRLTSFLAALGVVAIVTAYGWVVTPPYPEKGTEGVALLQGSVPLEVKWSRDSREHNYVLYDSLSQTVPDTAAALHVWPETAAPCYMSVDRYCQARVGSIASRSGAYHLVGALGVSYPEGVERHFNSCYQLNPDGQIDQRYDKVKLVPFSEQAPYQDHLPFLKAEVLSKYLSFIKTYDVQWWSDFYPGDTAKLFNIPDVTYGVLICFECTFPEYVRKMVRMGADYMVGITNDTWFHNSLGIYMHARIFITRAVENRIWMARSANSGLTFIVDPYGRIRQQLAYNEVGALVGKVGRLEEYSVFTRIGDVAGLVSFLILAAVIAILVVSWLIQKISRRSQSVA